MNRRTHVTCGVIGATAFCVYDSHKRNRPVHPGELLAYGIGGAIGSALPDLIEPAYSPRHRDTAHSVLALTTTALSLYKIDDWAPDLDPFVRALAKGLAIGYVSHLLLDASTPMGLPLIGNGGSI